MTIATAHHLPGAWCGVPMRPHWSETFVGLIGSSATSSLCRPLINLMDGLMDGRKQMNRKEKVASVRIVHQISRAGACMGAHAPTRGGAGAPTHVRARARVIRTFGRRGDIG